MNFNSNSTFKSVYSQNPLYFQSNYSFTAKIPIASSTTDTRNKRMFYQLHFRIESQDGFYKPNGLIFIFTRICTFRINLKNPFIPKIRCTFSLIIRLL
jgi:hypothetical protein